MIRLLIVDDHPVIRTLLQRLLEAEPDIHIVGAAEDGAAALALAPALRPDVVVMDVQMPRMDGITAAARLRAVAPRSAVIIFSSEDDQDTRSQAQAAGVRAFIAKDGALDGLLRAIRRAAQPLAAA